MNSEVNSIRLVLGLLCKTILIYSFDCAIFAEFQTPTISNGVGDFNCSTNDCGPKIAKIMAHTLYINIDVSTISL